MKSEPYLSVVVATRDDHHGGDPQARLRAALKVYKCQAESFRFPLEYIVVDWNSPAKSAGVFAQVKTWGLESDFLKIKVVEVPPAAHKKIDEAKIPFYQMIAKNVGIRRAKGKFVLASNIDIFLNDYLFGFLTKKNLKTNRMYRSDRVDLSVEIMAKIRDGKLLIIPEKFITRKHTRLKSFLKKDLPFLRKNVNLNYGGINSSVPWGRALKERARLWKKRLGFQGSAGFPLHTNGCGDFTLLARSAWEALRGYPEFRAFSFHIDSIFCHQAHESGFFEYFLPEPLLHYHIDHSHGWTPETNEELIQRLRAKKIIFIEHQLDMLIQVCRRTARPIFNPDDWGLLGEVFSERSI